MDLKEKERNFKQTSYLDYYNHRSRGIGRDINILESCENYHKTTYSESSILKDKILSNNNKYGDNRNVLYIHIPFCLTRCNYCPYFITKYSKDAVDDYIGLIEKEIKHVSLSNYAKTTTFECIYFGGGTPSILSQQQIERLCGMVFEAFNVKLDGEFTFESNPLTLTEEKIKTLKETGINRVSLGVQTFNAKKLKEMNCAHTPEQALEVIETLLKYDFCVNIDLMYGLVGQTITDIDKDLEIVKKIKKLQHVSLFPLGIMDGTPLQKQLYEVDKIDIEKHNELVIEYLNHIKEKMDEMGYEMENTPIQFHKKEFPEHKYVSTSSRILGIGAGAGSILDYGEFVNVSSYEEYKVLIESGIWGTDVAATLTEEQIYDRLILYGIIYSNRSDKRFEENVKSNFNSYYGFECGERLKNVTNEMVNKKFANITKDGKIVFTKRMWHLLNQVKIGVPSII